MFISVWKIKPGWYPLPWNVPGIKKYDKSRKAEWKSMTKVGIKWHIRSILKSVAFSNSQWFFKCVAFFFFAYTAR